MIIRHRQRQRLRGFTLVEIAVVAFLATLLIGAAILLWSRTNALTQKGAGMLDLQQVLQAITHTLRADVRTLVSISTCAPDRVTFLARRKGKEVEITYRFDATTRTLFRKASDAGETDFNGPRIVRSVAFEAWPGRQDFEYLQVALELETPSPKGAPASNMAVLHRFSSRSRDTAFEVVK